MINEHIDIQFWNKELENKSPEEIINWALQLTEKRIVTTSFGKYSAVLLSTFFKKDKDIMPLHQQPARLLERERIVIKSLSHGSLLLGAYGKGDKASVSGIKISSLLAFSIY